MENNVQGENNLKSNSFRSKNGRIIKKKTFDNDNWDTKVVSRLFFFYFLFF